MKWYEEEFARSPIKFTALLDAIEKSLKDRERKLAKQKDCIGQGPQTWFERSSTWWFGLSQLDQAEIDRLLENTAKVLAEIVEVRGALIGRGIA